MRVRLFTITFAVFVSALFGGVDSNAKPISVISENFEFYGDASEKAATEFVESLEAYRAILFTIYDINPGPEYLPVKIYGFKSQSRIEKLTGRNNIGGLYTTSLEGPAFLLSTEGGLKRGKPALTIAYHEYTHHVLSGFTNKVYPRWYNEGYADYLSTFDYDKRKGKFKLGLPSHGRAWALSQKKWLPYDVVLGSVRKYPFKSKGGKGNTAAQRLFYAQSWLATHYLQSTPAYKGKLAKYVDLLNEPNAPDDAFEIAMDVSIPDFEKEVRAYHKKNRYGYSIVTLNENVEIPSVQTQKISKAELRFRYGEAMRRMIRTKEGRDLAREFFDEAEEDLGRTAEISTSRALIALAENDLESAKSLAEDAFATAPDSRHVKRVLGIIELESYQKLGSQYGSINSARKYLISAMKAYPDDVTAHYYYAKSFEGNNGKPTKQAMSSAKSALGYYRSLDFMGSNLAMAKILENGGEETQSIPVYKRILTWARNPSFRRFAKHKLDRIEPKDDE